MRYKIIEINIEDMDKYKSIPISFTVKRILEPVADNGGLGGILLVEKEVDPYLRDHDATGSGPTGWHKRFDTSNWVRFAAIEESGKYVGGAVVAYNTDNVNMLEGRDDITVLWNIRVHPEYRGEGIGRLLFQKAASWSASKGCRMMKIETQNININACRFYRAMGCTLGAIRQHVYQEEGCEDEAQLFWYYNLQGEE